jgi:hypothetical protein
MKGGFDIMDENIRSLSTFKKIDITPSVIEKYSIRNPKIKSVAIEGHRGCCWVDSNERIVAWVNVVNDKSPTKRIQSIFLDRKYKKQGLYSQVVKHAIQSYGATDINIGNKDSESAKIFENLGFRKVSQGQNTTLYSKNKPTANNDAKSGTYKPIYVVLTHCSYGFANFVKFMTHATYSHASIAFDTGLKEVYSFASRGKDHTLVPLGFSEESLFRFVEQDKDAKYALYVMFVPPKDYSVMKSKVAHFKANKASYGYDVAGVVKNFFGKRSMNDKNKFCSGFVSEILNSGSTQVTHKNSDMMRPEDLPDVPNIHFVDAGLFRNYDKKEVDKRVSEIYNKHYGGNKAKKTAAEESAVII